MTGAAGGGMGGNGWARTAWAAGVVASAVAQGTDPGEEGGALECGDSDDTWMGVAIALCVLSGVLVILLCAALAMLSRSEIRSDRTDLDYFEDDDDSEAQILTPTQRAIGYLTTIVNDRALGMVPFVGRKAQTCAKIVRDIITENSDAAQIDILRQLRDGGKSSEYENDIRRYLMQTATTGFRSFTVREMTNSFPGGPIVAPSTASGSTRQHSSEYLGRGLAESPRSRTGGSSESFLPPFEETESVAAEVAVSPARNGGAVAAGGKGRLGLEAHFDSSRQLSAAFDSTGEAAEGDALESRRLEITRALVGVGADFDFDVRKVDQATDGYPLSVVTMEVFRRWGLIKKLELDKRKLLAFIERIEDGYDVHNAYHNRMHAADVVHRVACVIEHTEIWPCVIGAVEAAAVLIAAAVHDYEHPGTSNSYHVSMGNILARRFNDHAVLENHSLVEALEMLREESLDFIGHLPDTHKRVFRSTIITTVLCTDLAQHFDVLSKFQSKVDVAHVQNLIRDASQSTKNSTSGLQRARNRTFSPWSKRAGLRRRPSESAQSPTSDEEAPPAPVQPLDDAQVNLVLQMALKCADIGHCALPEELHVDWVLRLQEEFFVQGDNEKREGLPVSALMDRDKMGPASGKNQLGFFDFVVLPMMRAFTKAFPGARQLTANAEANYRYWKLDARVDSGTKLHGVSSSSMESVGSGRHNIIADIAAVRGHRRSSLRSSSIPNILEKPPVPGRHDSTKSADPQRRESGGSVRSVNFNLVVSDIGSSSSNPQVIDHMQAIARSGAEGPAGGGEGAAGGGEGGGAAKDPGSEGGGAGSGEGRMARASL